MRPYLQIISILFLSTFGCQPESVTVSPNAASPSVLREPPVTTPAANFRLKQMVVNGHTAGLGPYYLTTRFEYLQGRALKQAIIPPSSPNATELTFQYTYDDQGRVSSYQERSGRTDADGSVGVLYSFTFADNTIEWSYARILANGQKIAGPESNARNIYRTDAEGQITEWIQDGIVRFGRPTRARYVFTYERGNIVNATYLDERDKVEFTLTYQYDDKVNPFYNWTFTTDPILRSNRNNIVSVKYNDSAPSMTEYTYNEQGLPLTKKDVSKGAVLTYEYETF